MNRELCEANSGVRSSIPSDQEARRAGFTLVELLVVIGIIAVLVGILMPVLGKARQQANLVVCQTHLRQIGMAIALYVDDNQGTLPFGQWNFNGNQGADWSVLLNNELNAKYGLSFAAQTSTASNSYNGSAVINRGIFRDVDTIEGDAPLHYSCHPRLMPQLGLVDPADPTKKLTPGKMGSMKHSADMALVTDGSQWQTSFDGTDTHWWGSQPCCWAIDNWRFGEFGTAYTPAKLDFLVFNNANADNGSNIDIGLNQDTANNASFLWWDCSNGQVRARHMNNTAANFLFADGHVEAHFTQQAKNSFGNYTIDLMAKNINVQ